MIDKRPPRIPPQGIWIVLPAAMLTAACSGKNGHDTDASTDGGPDSLDALDGYEAPAAPAPPELPALPVLTPCPDGWREVEDPDTGAVTCDPWPEGGPHDCADDEAHFPGEPGCTTVGTPCGTGDWATDLPYDRTIIYVKAGVPSGGDGSVISPHATIMEAMGDVSPGDVIALSKGTFDEMVVILPDVTLWGACTAETLVTTTTPDPIYATINPAGTDTVIRNLTISGENYAVLNAVPGRTMTLDGVIVRDTLHSAVIIQMGSITMRNVAIRDTRSDLGVPCMGRGLEVQEGGLAEISRVVLEGNGLVGIYVMGAGTTLVAHDVVLRGPPPGVDTGEYSTGLLATTGGSVQLERASVEASSFRGIDAKDSGTLVHASDVIVRDTRPRPMDGAQGVGVFVDSGARLELDRAHIASNQEVGILFLQQSHGELADVVVSDTVASSETTGMAHGILVQDASDVLITRALLDGNNHAGIVTSMDGTVVDLVDVSVYHTQMANPDSEHFGHGIWISDGTTGTIARALMADNLGLGLVISGSGTDVDASDVTILDTNSGSDDKLGTGLRVSGGAACSISRAFLERNHTMGVTIEGEATTAYLEDIVVSHNLSEEATGWWGRGLQVSFGAYLEISRAILEHNQEMAMAGFGEGTQILGTDIVITGTTERACATSTCVGFGDGTGLCSMGGAHFDLSNFIVSNNILCGVQLGIGTDPHGERYPTGGSVDLHDGVVSGNPIGVNIQVGEYDLSRLMDNVLYFDNDRDLDSYDLPVPDTFLDP